jgi:DNA-binding response OmpR family regulator
MRVLLIEDDSATAQSIELMLKSESFNVYTTDLGEEGIDLGTTADASGVVILVKAHARDPARAASLWFVVEWACARSA